MRGCCLSHLPLVTWRVVWVQPDMERGHCIRVGLGGLLHSSETLGIGMVSSSHWASFLIHKWTGDLQCRTESQDDSPSPCSSPRRGRRWVRTGRGPEAGQVEGAGWGRAQAPVGVSGNPQQGLPWPHPRNRGWRPVYLGRLWPQPVWEKRWGLSGDV